MEAPLVNRCYGTWATLAYCCHYRATQSYHELHFCFHTCWPAILFHWVEFCLEDELCHVIVMGGWDGESVNGFKVPPHWQTSLYCFRILYTTSLQTVGILENSGIILMPLCEVGPLKAILRTSWSLYCNSGSVIRVLSISLFFKIFFHICVCPNCLFLRQMDDILMQPIWASTNPIWAHSRSQRIVLEQGAPHF